MSHEIGSPVCPRIFAPVCPHILLVCPHFCSSVPTYFYSCAHIFLLQCAHIFCSISLQFASVVYFCSSMPTFLLQCGCVLLLNTINSHGKRNYIPIISLHSYRLSPIPVFRVAVMLSNKLFNRRTISLTTTTTTSITTRHWITHPPLLCLTAPPHNQNNVQILSTTFFWSCPLTVVWFTLFQCTL